MKKLFQILVIGLLTVAFVGCSAKFESQQNSSGGSSTTAVETTKGPEKAETSSAAKTVETPEAPVEMVDGPPPEGTVTVKGKVNLAGTAPPMPPLTGILGKPECATQHATTPTAEAILVDSSGGVGNCFVYVSRGVRWKYDPPTEKVVFDQKGCLYSPRVVGVRATQPVEITNSDPTLHNVHILQSPAMRDTNRGQPANSPSITLKFNRPHIGVNVKCDVHPWMQAYACVVEHPFFAVTNPDGSFEFPEKLPAGTYTVTVWHEYLEPVEEVVTVADGATETMALTLLAP